MSEQLPKSAGSMAYSQYLGYIAFAKSRAANEINDLDSGDPAKAQRTDEINDRLSGYESDAGDLAALLSPDAVTGGHTLGAYEILKGISDGRMTFIDLMKPIESGEASASYDYVDMIDENVLDANESDKECALYYRLMSENVVCASSLRNLSSFVASYFSSNPSEWQYESGKSFLLKAAINPIRSGSDASVRGVREAEKAYYDAVSSKASSSVSSDISLISMPLKGMISRLYELATRRTASLDSHPLFLCEPNIKKGGLCSDPALNSAAESLLRREYGAFGKSGFDAYLRSIMPYFVRYADYRMLLQSGNEGIDFYSSDGDGKLPFSDFAYAYGNSIGLSASSSSPIGEIGDAPKLRYGMLVKAFVTGASPSSAVPNLSAVSQLDAVRSELLAIRSLAEKNNIFSEMD